MFEKSEYPVHVLVSLGILTSIEVLVLRICPFFNLKKGAVFLCGAVLLLHVAGCEDSPSIDVNADSSRLSDLTPGPDQDRLRVAIGAMLSPEITRQYYEDLIQLIGQSLNRQVLFIQRRTYSEINTMVKIGEVDVAFVCSGPYTKGHRDFGMEILAIPVVNGQKVYFSYILAHRDDNATNSLKDLKGHRFAFTDPNSNTGFFVPVFQLSKIGYTPDVFFKETFFTHSHDNSIRAVAEKLTDGAAVDSLIWEFLNDIDPSVTSRTKIISKSEPYGIPPVVVHPSMDSELKKDLRDVFLTVHEHSNTRALLQHLKIDRFEKGSDVMYDSVREMQQKIEHFKKKKGN